MTGPVTPEEAVAKVRELVAADHTVAVKAVEAALALAADTKREFLKYGAGGTPAGPAYWAGMANHAGLVEEALEEACGLMDGEVAS